MLEVVNALERGEEPSAIPNVYLKRDGEMITNALRPLCKDLAVYPMPDYSFEDHHALVGNHVRPLTHVSMESLLSATPIGARRKRVAYLTMTGRGCPHRCSYCTNDKFGELYGGTYFRWRSPESVIDELAWVRENMPYVNYVVIADDTFFARSLKQLQFFAEEYKAKIGLQFSRYASPLTVTSEKMDLLTEAGLVDFHMGVESGSPQMQKLFRRERMTNEKVLAAMHVANKFRDRFSPPSYDFLVDSPYETTEDAVETVRFVAQIPRPFSLKIFSLVMFPGTELYDMAKADGLITDEDRQVYLKNFLAFRPTYTTLLLLLDHNGRIPPFLLRLLVSRPVVAVMTSPVMRPIVMMVFTGVRLSTRVMVKLQKKVFALWRTLGKPEPEPA